MPLLSVLTVLQLGELPPEAPPMMCTARAAGTSGDIIAHRDDDDFEMAPTMSAPPVAASVKVGSNVAASTSGDIIGHSTPIRSADLAWSMKGRVNPGGKTGSVLNYANADFNAVHDMPARYSPYRNGGDIIANQDFRHDAERKMFQTRRQPSRGSGGTAGGPLC